MQKRGDLDIFFFSLENFFTKKLTVQLKIKEYFIEISLNLLL